MNLSDAHRRAGAQLQETADTSIPLRFTDPAEERRLLYVAVTRARRLAVISYARQRTLWGKALPGKPSPFLERLPADAVVHTEPEGLRRDPSSRQMKLF